ncbi:hypothetical protein D9M71_667360 [compost metagenome]
MIAAATITEVVTDAGGPITSVLGRDADVPLIGRVRGDGFIKLSDVHRQMFDFAGADLRALESLGKQPTTIELQDGHPRQCDAVSQGGFGKPSLGCESAFGVFISGLTGRASGQ